MSPIDGAPSLRLLAGGADDEPPATAAWLAELRLRCLAQGPDALSRQERAALANDHYSLTQLHRMVWQRGNEDHWDLGPYPTSAG